MIICLIVFFILPHFYGIVPMEKSLDDIANHIKCELHDRNKHTVLISDFPDIKGRRIPLGVLISEAIANRLANDNYKTIPEDEHQKEILTTTEPQVIVYTDILSVLNVENDMAGYVICQGLIAITDDHIEIHVRLSDFETRKAFALISGSIDRGLVIDSFLDEKQDEQQVTLIPAELVTN